MIIPRHIGQGKIVRLEELGSLRVVVESEKIVPDGRSTGNRRGLTKGL